jgi:hypothetical protein
MALIAHFFLELNNIPLSGHPSSIHSPTEGYVVYFQFLAFMNKATMKICGRFSCGCIFTSFELIPRSTVVGLYAKSMLSFIRSCQIVKMSSQMTVFPFWTWWYMPVMPAFGRLRQEDHKLEATLGYIARPCLKTKQQNNKKTYTK